MAEIAISAVLGKLVSFLEKEANLLLGLPDEVIRLRDELEFMRAFLLDADAAQRVDGERNKVWIKLVRDIAFDTEDILDEFLLRLPHRKVPPKQNRWQRWFSELVEKCEKSKSVKAFRRISTELQAVKSRMENISNVHVRYDGRLEKGTNKLLYSAPELRSNHGGLVGEAELVGVEESKQILFSKLRKEFESKRPALAVLGRGGLGKTTMANLVYNDAKVKQHFTHCAWITVSQSFKLDELLRDVIRQLSVGAEEVANSEGLSSMGTNLLKETIQRFLRDKQYLIVLDDVWHVASWDDIQSAFPPNDHGSRLILTTRKVDVALSSVRSCGGEIHELEPLSGESSWTLFCKKAFPRGLCPVNLEELCRKILQRCEGLPLAISAIGGMLAMKDNTCIDQFERVYKSLGAELAGNDNLNSVKKILSLSFDDLTGSLKSCLLYLTIFPKEHGIVKNKLIRLWIAESFVLKENGSRSSLEEVGEAYLNELFNRNLIQVSEKYDDGRVKACHIHDLTREIVMLKANEENFAIVADSETEPFSGKVRRLSVHKTVEKVREELEYFSKLRSLLLFQVEEFVSRFSLSNFLKGSRLLQVLDCSYVLMDSFPKEIAKLYNLRYLSLRGTGVKSIPPFIAKLRNLQTLNLKDTDVEDLPVEILQLSSLRHIHAYRFVQHGQSEAFTETKGFKALKGIDALTSLQSLCHMDVSEGGAEMLKSIGKLANLRRLGILRLRREDGADLCSAIDKLSHLVTLELTSTDTDEYLSLQSLSLIPQHLQRLYMMGRLERLPHWTPRLLSLKILVLRFSKLESDPLQSLWPLCNLVVLRLYRAYDGKELCFNAKCFPMLKILDIRYLGKLTKVTVKEEAIPCVETLIFEGCKMLEERPSGIERLKKLQQFELIDMNSKLVKSIQQISSTSSMKISSSCREDGANENTHPYMSNISRNIIQNHDFSEELEHWTANSCAAYVEAEQHGNRYAVVHERTKSWQGLEQDITCRIALHSVYTVSVSVSFPSHVEGTHEIEATLRLEYQERENDYVSVGRTSMSSETWKELIGTISLKMMPRKIIFYLHGPSPGIEIRIRSVVIEELSEIIRNPRFEDGLENWAPRNGGCKIFETECLGYGGYISSFSGKNFACTQNRKESWNGIEQDITGRVCPTLAYEITAYVRVFCNSNDTEAEVIATLYVKRSNSHEDYIEFARVQATDYAWKKLHGKFLMIDDEPLSVVVYLEGPPPGVDILLDSLVIKRIEHSSAPPVIENANFGVNIIENSGMREGKADGWFGLGNCILSVEKGSPRKLPPLASGNLKPNDDELTGHYLLSTNRIEDWMGPAQMVTDKLKLFLTYQVCAWVKIGYGAKGPQCVSIKLEVTNESQQGMEESWVRCGEVEIEAENYEWHEIAGSFRIEKKPARVMIYVFGPDPGIELMVAGLMVFPVDRTARFQHLEKTKKERMRDVVLTFSSANSSNPCITSVRVKKSFPFGSCLYRSNLDNEKFKKFFVEHFNCAVFADEMMWSHTEPKKGCINYDDADKMLEFCESNGIKVRGHCIFWEVEGEDPEWISSLSKSQLTSATKKRLKGLIRHYKERVEHYNVVNEMLPGSFYKNRLGAEGRAELFKQAKKLDPKAHLFTNENNVDGGCHFDISPEKYIALVKDLSEKGAPIDGIGIQGRNKAPVDTIIRSALDKLSALELPIWYTELEFSSTNEHVRADDLEVVIREALAHPKVEGMMLWGFWELCMGENTDNNSHLVNAEGELNEAGKRFVALKEEFSFDEVKNVDENGKVEFSGFHGAYDVEVKTVSGTLLNTIKVEKGDGPLEVAIDV